MYLINPVSSKTSTLSWKDWCWSWSSNTLATWCEELIHWKRLWCWERLKTKGEAGSRGSLFKWHHQLNGHEFEQTPGESWGQRSLVCCSPEKSCKKLDTTRWLNNRFESTFSRRRYLFLMKYFFYSYSLLTNGKSMSCLFMRKSL